MHFLWHWNDFSGVFRYHLFYRFLLIFFATNVDITLIIQDARSSCNTRYYIQAFPECYPPFQQLLSPSLGSQRETKDTHVVSCVAFISETSEMNVCGCDMIEIQIADFILNVVSKFAAFISSINVSRELLFVNCWWKLLVKKCSYFVNLICCCNVVELLDLIDKEIKCNFNVFCRLFCITDGSLETDRSADTCERIKNENINKLYVYI